MLHLILSGGLEMHFGKRKQLGSAGAASLPHKMSNHGRQREAKMVLLLPSGNT